MDMTLRKRFLFSESRNLELRADVNNLTNTVSFDFPINTCFSIGQSDNFSLHFSIK